jgi:hypothetical protein
MDAKPVPHGTRHRFGAAKGRFQALQNDRGTEFHDTFHYHEKTLLLTLLALLSASLLAQNPHVTVQDDAKVGLIVTGTGNTITPSRFLAKAQSTPKPKRPS